MPVSFRQWLERAPLRHPDAVALLSDDAALTFSQLIARSGAVAAALSARLKADALLTTGLTSRYRTLLALYAAIQMERPFLSLPPNMTETRRRRIVQKAGEQVAVKESDAAVALCGEQQTLPPAAGGVGFRLLVTTSGSDGEPKLVGLSTANLAAAVRAARQRIPLNPGDCWLCCLPLHHIGGLSVPLRCLEAGATVLLHEGFDPAAVLRDLCAREVTHLSLVPTMLDALADVTPPPSLQAVLVGGAALNPETARRAHANGWPLCVSYGMSETASQVATDCGPEAGLRPGFVGLPLAGFDVRVANPDDSGIGSIRVRGPALMEDRGESGTGLNNGWLETGDLGRLDEDGALTVLGRADDMLISGGENIHPLAVEPVLRDCPGVHAALLTAVSDPVWGERLVALFTGPAEAADVEAYCRKCLSGAQRPRLFLPVDDLPLLGPGKPARRAARRLAEAHFRS